MYTIACCLVCQGLGLLYHMLLPGIPNYNTQVEFVELIVLGSSMYKSLFPVT